MMSADTVKNRELVCMHRDLIPLALIFILVVVFLNDALSPLNNVAVLSSQFADTKSYFYPARSFGFSDFRQGTIPLWNPYVYGGTPFVATLQSAIFYPFNLIFAVLPISYAVNWSIALHLFLSGTFTYYLLKYYGVSRFGATMSGIVYTFSAPQIMHIYAGHLNVLIAMVWTPLMFLFLDRLVKGDGWRFGVYLSITLALQLLAGQPQYLFYSLMALSAYLIFSMVSLKIDGVEGKAILIKGSLFVAFVCLGLILAAIQILPTSEMTKYSTREDLTYDFVSSFSFPPENLITLLVPDFFGNMLNSPYWGKNLLWEMSAYVGVMPLLFAVLAIFYVRKRVVWFFAGLAFLSVVLALGKYTPLLKLLYSYVPGFNLFRGNSKFIFLNALSLATLAGFGADALISHASTLDKRLRAGAIGSGIFLMTALLGVHVVLDEAWFREAISKVISSGELYNNPELFMQGGFEVVAAATFNKGLLWTAGLLVLGVAILTLYSYGGLKRKAFTGALLGIVVFDLFAFGMRYMTTFDSKEVYWDEDIVNSLRQEREPFRVIAPGMDVNTGMVAGIETLSGYDTIMVKRYSEFINISQGLPPDRPNLWVNVESINKMTNLLNAKYVIIRSGQEIDSHELKVVYDNGRYRIYQNLNALPRAFIVHGAKVIRDRDAIFRELVSPGFDPFSYAVIEEELDAPLNGTANSSPAPRFMEYSPNKVIVEASLVEPGLLVLGDTYYPGWKAFVDGKESKIYPANYVMRGVVVPEGRHIVEFRYDPISFRFGAAVTLLSLVLMAGFLAWDIRKKRNSVIH